MSPSEKEKMLSGLPYRPGDPVQHHVARPASQFGGRLRTDQQFGGGTGSPQRGPDGVRLLGVADRDRFDVQFDRLLGDQARIPASGCQRDHSKSVRVAPDHVDRLGADGPGGSEQDDVAAICTRHRTILPCPPTAANISP
jgi:hypothetical protein